jgi:hypothetical protein
LLTKTSLLWELRRGKESRWTKAERLAKIMISCLPFMICMFHVQAHPKSTI